MCIVWSRRYIYGIRVSPIVLLIGKFVVGEVFSGGTMGPSHAIDVTPSVITHKGRLRCPLFTARKWNPIKNGPSTTYGSSSLALCCHYRLFELHLSAMLSHDPTYPLFPTFAFIGFVVSLIPLPWHIQAWNAGTCAFMIWTGLSCLNEFINALVWKGNVLNVVPVWCDICRLSILFL
jgi:hypothetical protein